MEAILWDGNKQLKGEITFKEDHLDFSLKDFTLTNLNFRVGYDDIVEVNHHKVYNIVKGGIEIVCKDGRKNVFVVEDPTLLKGKIMMGIR